MFENSEEKSIKGLPNEILLTIFSYLQIRDVKYNVSKVCVRWSDLARDKKLWKHLFFKTTTKCTKTFGTSSWYSTLKFLENTPELQNVIISQGHSEEEIVEILQSLNSHCLYLYHIEFDLDVNSFAKHLQGLNNLLENVESLKLRLGSSHSQACIFKILPAFKKLKKIEFIGGNPDSFGFRLFLRDCPHLENINVAAVEFSKMNFMSLWKSKDKFVSLDIKTDKLDVNCLKLLLMFPKLKSLKLNDGNLSPEKLSRIGNLNCLKNLHLQEDASSPVLTATTLKDFFQEGNFLQLRELKLYKSRLDDEGAIEIRRNCPNLKYLEIMTYPRSLSSLSKKALLHFLHCTRLEMFEILFDNSQEADWIYRRIRHVRHECDINKMCPLGLEGLLECWDEIQIPVD